MNKYNWPLYLIACLLFLSCKDVSHTQLSQFDQHDLWLSETGAIIRYVKDQPILFHRNIRYPIEIKSDTELSFKGQDEDVYEARYITNGASMAIDITTEEGPFIRFADTRRLEFFNYHEQVSGIAVDSAVIVRQNKEDIKVNFDEENPLNAEMRKDLFTIGHQYYNNYRPNRDDEVQLRLHDGDQGLIKRYTAFVPNTVEFPYRYITLW